MAVAPVAPCWVPDISRMATVIIMLDETVLNKLAQIEDRYEQLNELMAQPEVAADINRLQTLVREQNQIVGVVSKYRNYARLLAGIRDAESLLVDGDDPELRVLAQEDVIDLLRQVD